MTLFMINLLIDYCLMTHQQLLKTYVGKVISGEEFKRLFPQLVNNLYKLTAYNENHNGLQFKTGINVDRVEFNPNDECLPGGIYFIEENEIYKWLAYKGKFMHYCRKVVLLDDSKIYIERNKFKADKIKLEERVKIVDMDIWNNENCCLKAVNHDGTNISIIKKPTEAVQLAAVKQNVNAFEYIENPVESVILEVANFYS